MPGTQAERMDGDCLCSSFQAVLQRARKALGSPCQFAASRPRGVRSSHPWRCIRRGASRPLAVSCDRGGAAGADCAGARAIYGASAASPGPLAQLSRCLCILCPVILWQIPFERQVFEGSQRHGMVPLQRIFWEKHPNVCRTRLSSKTSTTAQVLSGHFLTWSPFVRA